MRQRGMRQRVTAGQAPPSTATLPASTSAGPLATPADAERGLAFTWHAGITDFKRRLLEQALASTGGNRTHAARALGLQRTYLLRLIRDLGVSSPPPERRRP